MKPTAKPTASFVSYIPKNGMLYELSIPMKDNHGRQHRWIITGTTKRPHSVTVILPANKKGEVIESTPLFVSKKEGINALIDAGYDISD